MGASRTTTITRSDLGPAREYPVTRLRPMRLPAQAARQLPDQSTTLRVEPSSTSDSRLRGAQPKSDILLPWSCVWWLDPPVSMFRPCCPSLRRLLGSRTGCPIYHASLGGYPPLGSTHLQFLHAA